MACLTTEHVIPFTLATARRACQIGDHIWVIQNVFGAADFEIWKIDTNTKNCQKVEFTNRDPVEIVDEDETFGSKDFTVFTSKDKIYMKILIEDSWSSQLMEFDTRTLVLRNFVVSEQEENYEFDSIAEHFIDDDTVYSVSSEGEVDVLNINTLQKTTTYPFPHEQDDGKYYTYKLCDLDTSVYLLHTAPPGVRSVYRYDTDNSKFELFSESVEIPWAKPTYESDFNNYEDSYVWTRNNLIYQSFICNREKIVVDVFNVKTKEWNTIYQYELQHNFLRLGKMDYSVNICGCDKFVYIILDNCMELVIREIDQNPKLGAICLYELATIEAEKFHDFTSSAVMLPDSLRAPFANILACKTREKEGLGQLEFHLNMIAKFEVAKEQLAEDEDMGNELFSRVYNFWLQLNSLQNRHESVFEQLQKDLEQRLKQPIWKKMKVEEKVQKNMDAQAAKFEELVQQYETDLKPRMAISSNYDRLMEK